MRTEVRTPSADVLGVQASACMRCAYASVGYGSAPGVLRAGQGKDQTASYVAPEDLKKIAASLPIDKLLKLKDESVNAK